MVYTVQDLNPDKSLTTFQAYQIHFLYSRQVKYVTLSKYFTPVVLISASSI